jgi:hypothetical protein
MLLCFHFNLIYFVTMICLFRNCNLRKAPSHPPPSFSKIDIMSLHAVNQIGAAGAAAVASALEPRRNGDGSWSPSTALTELDLWGKWVLILMVVTDEE